MKNFFTLGMLFLFITLIVLAIFIYTIHSTNGFLHHTIRTAGKVVYIENNDSNGTNADDFGSSSPIVEFHTTAGEKVIYASKVSLNPDPYNIGDTIAVYYDPNNLKKTRVGSFISIWILSIVSGSFLLVFSLLTAGFFWITGLPTLKKKKKKKKKRK